MPRSLLITIIFLFIAAPVYSVSAKIINFGESGDVLYLEEDVGIGTSTPAYRLDVQGYGNFLQPVQVGTPINDTHATTKSYVDTELGQATSTYGHWLETGDGHIYNTNIGNVGIGTSTPGVKLEVVGDIRVDSANDICIENGTCLSDVLGGFVQRTAEGSGVVSQTCSGDERIVNASVQFDGGYQTNFADVNIDYLNDSA
ncbi:MAG TPA: hypothetical protein VKO42_03965, partial [Patescibacteria group bacterium]|nr:hypothetical protein [Patescibacteria group bacterium]